MMGKNKIFLILLFLCLLLFILDKKGFLYGVRKTAETVVVPVQEKIFDVEGGVAVLSFWRSGEARIKNLEQRNWELAGQVVTLSQVERENSFLRQQLEVGEVRPYKKVLAQVLSRDNFLVTDKGQEDGVGAGDMAVVENFLVGIVAKTTPRRSFILLPTDSASKILVKVRVARGEVLGQFGTGMILDKISQNEEILEGDTIFTSGEGTETVPNLIVGKVGKIKSRESDIFKEAQVVPAIDYRKLGKIFIIL